MLSPSPGMQQPRKRRRRAASAEQHEKQLREDLEAEAAKKPALPTRRSGTRRVVKAEDAGPAQASVRTVRKELVIAARSCRAALRATQKLRNLSTVPLQLSKVMATALGHAVKAIDAASGHAAKAFADVKADGKRPASSRPASRRSAKRGSARADQLAHEILQEAAASGRKLSDRDVERVLESWEFRKNTSRINVMPAGQDFVLSEMLGLVCIRMYQRLVVASKSRAFPDVTRLLVRFLEDNPPQGLPPGVKFPFTTICVNRDYAARRHRDTRNSGVSVIRAFGSFTGGRLRYWPSDPGPKTLPNVGDLKDSEAVQLNVCGSSVVVDSTKAHEVEPFQGSRFSLVYFTIPSMEPSKAELRKTVQDELGLTIFSAEESQEIWHQMAGDKL